MTFDQYETEIAFRNYSNSVDNFNSLIAWINQQNL